MWKWAVVAVVLALVVAACGFGYQGAARADVEPIPVEHVASGFSSQQYAVSPDGKQVALVVDGDLWLLKPAGDTPYYGWIPGGTDLARLTRGEPLKGNGYMSGRWIAREPVWVGPNALVYLRSAYWETPDVEWPEDRELWLAAQGAKARRLGELPQYFHARALLPSPEGKRLLILEQSYSPARLFVADLAEGKVQQVKAEGLPGAPVDAAWSPDGQSLALTVPTGTSVTLFTLPAAGGKAQRLVSMPGVVDPGGAPGLAWQPDGKAVLLHTWQLGEPGTPVRHTGSWAVPVAGGAPARVVAPIADLASPAWAPDGRWLAYRDRKDGLRYALHLSSGQRVRLGGWTGQSDLPFRFQGSSVWYPCPSGLCRTGLPTVE